MLSLLALATTPTASALTLQALTPLQVGTRNTATATRATPGASVTFVYAFGRGATPVPGCPNLTVPLANPTIAGSAVANAQGTASLTAFVPPSVSGNTALVVAVEASSCTVSNLTTNAFPLVDWADVEPIFSSSCAGGCHWGQSPRTASGGFPLNGPGDMVNVPSGDVRGMDRIEPFDTQASYVWHKIEGTHRTVGGAGSRMPLNGPYLSAQQTDLIEAWILDGALP